MAGYRDRDDYQEDRPRENRPRGNDSREDRPQNEDRPRNDRSNDRSNDRRESDRQYPREQQPDRDNRSGVREDGQQQQRDRPQSPQIFKYVTKDRILDISDMLNTEKRRSKISIVLLAFGQDFKQQEKVRAFADPDDFKLVCFDILNNFFHEWTDHKGSPSDNGFQARIMTIRKDVKYRQPYVIKIDNGQGEAMKQGAVKMVKMEESLTLLMPEFDARRMAQTVLDYIRDWEIVNFKVRRESSIPERRSSSGSQNLSSDRYSDSRHHER